MENEFNKRQLTTLARTLAEIIGAEAPKQADKNFV